MKIEHKDGKIHITTKCVDDLASAVKVYEGVTKEGTPYEHYEIRMIPVVLTTEDGMFNESEKIFIEKLC